MTAYGRRTMLAAFVSVAVIAGATGCARRPLPQADSPAAHLYVAQCGNCHVAYDPRELTAAMWETQVATMDDKIRESGRPPLSDADRKTILDYLKRNAGTE
ncbi:MAG TPA: hypothetical protein VMT58_02295 [Candidatus Binataceae bacterium]|nr:hypothetical protein [Candidatus Binataceae bacterium]